jgi:hypothetical protein
LFSKKLPYLLLIALYSLVVFTWYTTGQQIVNPGDLNYSINPKQDLIRSLSFWDEFQGFGAMDAMAIARAPMNLFLTVLSEMGVSLSNQQKILFYILVIVSGISSFEFLANEFKNEKLVYQASLLGAFFYSFNIYVLVYRWGSGYIMGMFMYASLPLIIKSYKNILINKDINKNISLLIAGIIVSMPSLNNPIYGLPAIIFIIIETIYIIKNKNLKIEINKLIKIIGILVIIFMPYIVALVVSVEPSLKSVSISSKTFNQIEINSSESNIWNIIRGIPDWAFNVKHNNDYYYSYSNKYLKYKLDLFIPIVTLIFLWIIFIDKKEIRNKRNLAYLTVFIVSLFIAKGLQEPFGFINEKYLSLVRMPMEKVGPCLTLTISYFLVFITIYFNRNQSNLKFKVYYIFLIVILLLTSYPIFSGDHWRDQGKSLPGYRFEIPEYMYHLKYELESDDSTSRIIQLPPVDIQIPGTSSAIYRGLYYNGPEIFERLIDKPLIAIYKSNNNDNLSKILNYLEMKISNIDYDINEITKIAALLNIKYFILREDLIQDKDKRISDIFSYQKYNILKDKVIKRFNKINLGLVDNYYGKIIGSTNDILKENIIDIAKNENKLIQSDKNNTITFKKMSMTFYITESTIYHERNLNLFLNTKYSDNWVLKIIDIEDDVNATNLKSDGNPIINGREDESLVIAPNLDIVHKNFNDCIKHEVGMGYGNLWNINLECLLGKKNEIGKVGIKAIIIFKPQLYLYLSAVISLLGLILLILKNKILKN